MPQLSITKVFTYEAAHALLGYDGLCANLHGHSYRLEVTVCKPALPASPGFVLKSETSDPKTGMLMDFSDLKRIVHQAIIEPLDHALILNRDTDPVLIGHLRKNYRKVACMPFQPTSENMVLDFARRLSELLPPDIRLKKIRLYETATSFTDWEND